MNHPAVDMARLPWLCEAREAYVADAPGAYVTRRRCRGGWSYRYADGSRLWAGHASWKYYGRDGIGYAVRLPRSVAEALLADYVERLSRRGKP